MWIKINAHSTGMESASFKKTSKLIPSLCIIYLFYCAVGCCFLWFIIVIFFIQHRMPNLLLLLLFYCISLWFLLVETWHWMEDDCHIYDFLRFTTQLKCATDFSIINKTMCRAPICYFMPLLLLLLFLFTYFFLFIYFSLRMYSILFILML